MIEELRATAGGEVSPWVANGKGCVEAGETEDRRSLRTGDVDGHREWQSVC